MTTTYHTDIATAAPNTAATFNAPLGQLDAAIGNTLNGSNPFTRQVFTNSALTLATDALNVLNASYVTVSAETGTADNLKTLSNLASGQVVILRAASTHVITIKHGTGNIFLNGSADLTMSGNVQIALMGDPNGNATDVFIPAYGMGVIYPRTQLGASAANMSISSIPATPYKHLRLVIEARGDIAAANESLKLQFNADVTAGNYYSQHQYAFGSTNTALEILGTSAGVLLALSGAGASAPANSFGIAVIEILNYLSTSAQKHVVYQGGVRGGTGTGTVGRTSGFGAWLSTAAITSLVLAPNGSANFVSGSALTLYGFN